MPTVSTANGLRVVVYPNDHRPAHVHVIGNGREAVFNLHCPGGPSELRENYGFSRMELSRISKELNHQIESLCVSWRTIHGNY
jgi:hypothetical protein